MAFPILRSTTNWPPRPKRRDHYQIDTKGDVENTLIFPYDETFFSFYGDFLGQLDSLAHRFSLTDDELQGILSVSSPAMLIDIMLHEEDGDMCLTESMCDEIYGNFDDDVAAAYITLLTEFYNSGIKPECFGLLQQVHRQSWEKILAEVVPLKEEDATIYVFLALGE